MGGGAQITTSGLPKVSSRHETRFHCQSWKGCNTLPDQLLVLAGPTWERRNSTTYPARPTRAGSFRFAGHDVKTSWFARKQTCQRIGDGTTLKTRTDWLTLAIFVLLGVLCGSLPIAKGLGYGKIIGWGATAWNDDQVAGVGLWGIPTQWRRASGVFRCSAATAGVIHLLGGFAW